MGKIIMLRESNYAGAVASYNIFLDNQKIGSIKNAGQLEIDIANGNHEIYLTNAILKIGKSNVLNFNSTDNSVIKILVKSVMSSISGIKLELVSNNNNFSKKIDDKYEMLEKLNELKIKGTINEEEFENEKKKILEGI